MIVITFNKKFFFLSLNLTKRLYSINLKAYQRVLLKDSSQQKTKNSGNSSYLTNDIKDPNNCSESFFLFFIDCEIIIKYPLHSLLFLIKVIPTNTNVSYFEVLISLLLSILYPISYIIQNVKLNICVKLHSSI